MKKIINNIVLFCLLLFTLSSTQNIEASSKSERIIKVEAGKFGTAILRKNGTVDYTSGSGNNWENIIDITYLYHKTIIGVQKDGRIVSNDYRIEEWLSEWKDIIKVDGDDFGDGNLAGLKKDGTVVIYGFPDEVEAEVSTWTDIIQISVGTKTVAGLKKDGTVVSAGDNDYAANETEEIASWNNIKQVSVGHLYTAALTNDGRVLTTTITKSFVNKNEWLATARTFTNVQQISSGVANIVALKNDGTVLSAEDTKFYSDYDYDVSKWKNIKYVDAGFDHVVGITKKGKLKGTGDNKRFQLDFSWFDY